jgi:hypothetical protein
MIQFFEFSVLCVLRSRRTKPTYKGLSVIGYLPCKCQIVGVKTQDFVLCSGLLVAIIKTTFLTFISIRYLISHM